MSRIENNSGTHPQRQLVRDPFADLADDVDVRGATNADREEIRETITSQLGSANPCLRDFEGWFRDPDGILRVARVNGSFAGVFRVHQVDPREWWLEGLAVRDEHKRRGVALRLIVDAYRLWYARDGRTLRAMIDGGNRPILSLLSQFEAEWLDEANSRKYVHYIVSGDQGTHGFELLQRSNIPQALEIARGSALDASTGGLIEDRWRWRELTSTLLAELVERGEAYSWRQGQGLAILWSRRDAQVPLPELRVAFAASRDGLELVEDLLRFSGRNRLVHWRVPEEWNLRDDLERSGFKRRASYDDEFHIISLVRRRPPVE